MNNHKDIEAVFNSLAKEYVNDEKRTGGVLLGVFSEDENLGFNAAHGDAAAITALLTTIIENTARNAGMSPYELMMAISLAIKDCADIEDEDE